MRVDIHRLADRGLGNSAWLVDLGDGSALVVDPSRDPRGPLAEAGVHDLRVRWVAETHLHADFVSGARELLHEVPDAQLLASSGAELAYPYRGVGDGDEVEVGGLTLQVIATPGHTPEHVAYLLLDGSEPVALFSGGTLIVGGVARPDLVSPDLTESLARAAWRSVTGRLLDLPDDLAVYPTHGGASFCSTGGGNGATTTIGEQRATNHLLQATSEDEFVERLLGSLGTFPPYFLRLRDVNRRGPDLYGTTTPQLARLTPDDLARRVAEGAVLLDVRPVEHFAAGHIPGSLSIALRPEFATWLGWLVDDPATPLVFVLDDDQDHDDLVRQSLKVGYERLAGELAGGLDAWRAAGREVTTTELVESPPREGAVLDVRQRSEWDEEHLPGAVHVELGALGSSLDAVPDGRIVVHCEHGLRSTTAASVLERAGRGDVAVFTGGPDDWQREPADR